MNILFLTISDFTSLSARGIYPDLMRELAKRGHHIYVASPTERRLGKATHIIHDKGAEILKIRTLNIQKTNIIEKGIGILLLEPQFDCAIKKYLGDVKFDLVIYSTPPITFNKVIAGIKKRCAARSYLMLKDIFPQNAVDLGMMKEGSLLHRMFRKKERRLYQLSDRIGCMSLANCQYIIDNNTEVKPEKVELCPNAIEPIEQCKLTSEEREKILSKYSISADKTVFIYGGNLGKPQGLNFLLKVIETNESQSESHIMVVGNGTEYPKIKKWFSDNKPNNSTLLSALPKSDYDKLVRACDVGLIFLDPRFTIPNFPSRLLSYLENSMPVLLATDSVTDMGRLAEAKGFGKACINGDLQAFMSSMQYFVDDKSNIERMGVLGHNYLLSHYTVRYVADIIEQE